MNDRERAARTARIQAERAARGQPPLIQSPAVYRLLAAVLSAAEQDEREAAKTS